MYDDYYISVLDVEDEDGLWYGTPRHSGRYPWGSGKNPRRNRDFVSYYQHYKEQGMSEKEIADRFGMSTTELRKKYSVALNERKKDELARAIRLYDKYRSYSEVGRIMGKNESTIRGLLDPSRQSRQTSLDNTVNLLKDSIEDMRYIDVGKGIERYVGVSEQKLANAVQKLVDEEGYKLFTYHVRQIMTGKNTTMMVLAAPDVEWEELRDNQQDIGIINGYSEDGGQTYQKFKPVQSIDSSRVYIRYTEEGGSDLDGTIELRRGVQDLDLGSSRYAQVRIGVDDKLYLKGMALYSDDIPEGYDVVFNTNKHEGTPMEKVFKPLKEDADGNINLADRTVFGAEIRRQRTYIDEDGNEHTSALNIVNEEGDWDKWSRTLPSQFLSKQSPQLAKQQLDVKYAERLKEFEDYKSLENAALKKKLLTDLAETVDADAVNLKAASLPRQANYIILPVPELKDNEIYAPNYKDGETVVLVRYPHASKTEIPELKVNNKSAEAIRKMGGALDAVGINPKVAQQLSGADFDGDTVTVIPNNDGYISVRKMYEKMVDFDPKESYSYGDKEHVPVKENKSFNKGIEMGKVSNLITDMTLKGASDDEIIRAMKHSMVVIDAQKHDLDWKQSEIDNGIKELRIKYQDNANGGASTLISQAKGQTHPLDRKEISPDPETGEKRYIETGKTRVNKKTGKEELVTFQSTKMAETKDAFELSSGTRMETVYAKYANDSKSLANQIRKEVMTIEPQKKDKHAEEVYASEVASLNAKYNESLKNAPLERKAQVYANNTFWAKKNDNPDMEKDEVKKLKRQSLAEGRAKSGASRSDIYITDKEWEALNSNAISSTKALEIYNHANQDRLRELYSPKSNNSMSPATIALAEAKLKAGYSRSEVAESLGVSASTIAKYVELPDRDLTDTTR